VVAARSRSVAADTAGNAFVASRLDGAPVFDAPRALAATAVAPNVAALPDGQGAAVAYTVGDDVVVTAPTY